jgi:hypothetical protein
MCKCVSNIILKTQDQKLVVVLNVCDKNELTDGALLTIVDPRARAAIQLRTK